MQAYTLIYSMENQQQKLVIRTKDGKPFPVPPEGSLGLLALGYKGLMAWRQSRVNYTKLMKQQMDAKNNFELNPDDLHGKIDPEETKAKSEV